MRKWLGGTVEEIYENLVKIKPVSGGDSPNYEWFNDDASSLRHPADSESDEPSPNVEGTPMTRGDSSEALSYRGESQTSENVEFNF